MANTNELILVEKQDIVAIADEVRAKTGNSGLMSIEGIAQGVRSITGGSSSTPTTPTTPITPTLQNKTVTPNKTTQTINADTGYDGLDTVTVNPIPEEYIKPIGTSNITQNGLYDIKTFSKVNVNVENSGGSGQNFIPQVEDFPEPTAELEGTYLKYHDDVYECKRVKGWMADLLELEIGSYGDSIWFDTTKIPEDYLATDTFGNGLILRATKSTDVEDQEIDFILACSALLNNDPEIGNCYIVVGTTSYSDNSQPGSLLGIAYINCDVLTVEQFNTELLPSLREESGYDIDDITTFGWQTDHIDISSIADFTIGTDNSYSYDYMAYPKVYHWYTSADQYGKKDAVYINYTESVLLNSLNMISPFMYARKIVFGNLVKYVSTGSALGSTIGLPMLEHVVIGSNVRMVAGNSFAGCTNLKTVTFKGTPEQIVETVFGKEGEENTAIFEIRMPWAEGQVAGAPWGAINAVLIYNYTGE